MKTVLLCLKPCLLLFYIQSSATADWKGIQPVKTCSD